MKNRIVIFVVFVCCLWTMPGIVRAQLSVHQFDQLMKKIDDVLWYEKVGDIAHVDKVYYVDHRVGRSPIPLR